MDSKKQEEKDLAKLNIETLHELFAAGMITIHDLDAAKLFMGQPNISAREIYGMGR